MGRAATMWARRRGGRVSWAIALAALLGACGDVDEAGEPASAPRLAALLDVSRTAPGSATLQATFLRYGGLRGERLMELVAPSLQDEAPEHGCLPQQEAARRSATSEEPAEAAFVELLDAGELSVASGGRRVLLPARSWPALGEVLGGVFYAADLELERAPEATIRLEAAGSEAPPVESDVRVPAPPRLLALSREGGGLQARWTHAAGDRLQVRVEGERGVLVCRVEPDGRLQVDAADIARVGAPRRLLVQRLRLRSVELPGYDEAWVLSSSRATVPLRP